MEFECIRLECMRNHRHGLIVFITVGDFSLIFSRKKASSISCTFNDIFLFNYERGRRNWSNVIRNCVSVIPIIPKQLEQLVFSLFTVERETWAFFNNIIYDIVLECYRNSIRISVNAHQNNSLLNSGSIYFESSFLRQNRELFESTNLLPELIEIISEYSIDVINVINV